MTRLPGQAAHGRQAFHVHEGVPGGDATVMLVPASASWKPGHLRPVTVEQPNDVRPPLDVLTYWLNVWHDYSKNPGTTMTADLGSACTALDRVLSPLSELQVFGQLARDLVHVLRQIEDVVHAGERPDTSRVPCLDCGTRLQKVWADREADDSWCCPTCGAAYDQGRYERAKHDHLASSGADHYVPLMDAVAVTGRPEATVRKWVAEGTVNSQRGGSGRLEVWWPDVRDQHRATPIRSRHRR